MNDHGNEKGKMEMKMKMKREWEWQPGLGLEAVYSKPITVMNKNDIGFNVIVHHCSELGHIFSLSLSRTRRSTGPNEMADLPKHLPQLETNLSKTK